jgi:hypothetical protein
VFGLAHRWAAHALLSIPGCRVSVAAFVYSTAAALLVDNLDALPHPVPAQRIQPNPISTALFSPRPLLP